MASKLRFSGSLIVGLVALALLAPAANAGSGLVGSLLGTSCAGTGARVFLPWLDPSQYVLAPGGDFESGAAGWTLSGGAQVVVGNESYGVGGADDAHSLALPDGSSATSAPVCIGAFRPDLRLFVSNAGSPGSVLRVQVIFRGLTGVLGVVEGGVVYSGNDWRPTPPMLALQLPVGATSAQYRFTPIGSGGGWRIDDVYVDPFVCR